MKKSTLVFILFLTSSFSHAAKILTCVASIKSVNNQYYAPVMGHSSDSRIQAKAEGNHLNIYMNKELGFSKIEHIFVLDAIKDSVQIGAQFNLKFSAVFERTAHGVTTQFTIKDQTNPNSYNNTKTYNSNDDEPFELTVRSPTGASFSIFCKTE